ncbi:MAG: hypothetical protein ABI432_09120, partial [Flavobacteriales bacterium]
MSFSPIRQFRHLLGALALTLLATVPAFAQLPTTVDIDLVQGVGANELDVMLRANGNSFNQVISNLLFTVRWVDTSPATLGLGSTGTWCPLPNSAFSPGPSTMVTTGGFKYRTYSSIGLQQIGIPQDPDGGCGASGQTLTANTWVKVFTITVSGNTGCTDFNIVNDAYTGANNRNYFISLNGQQVPPLTGTIQPTGVAIGTPAAPTPGSYGPLCSNGTPITLGGTPAGGVWTGTGVSGTGPYTFNPASGTQTLTYTVTTGLCSSNAPTTITVSVVPTTANAGPDQTVCASGAT